MRSWARRSSTVLLTGLPAGRLASPPPRARHPEPAAPAATTTTTRRPRRDTTVYVCGECEQRYLGRQWCPDCHQPCHRVDIGGLCPQCDEPVTVTDLLPS
ncbi:MAG TPA: hypothetical protein VGO16_09185 [Pseudonocardiaceae bacterium]|nr:hypothetical protein [Pseudonocardiaceae bacterium]